MTTENQKTALKDSTFELPADNKSSAAEGGTQPSEREVFAGDEDFFRQLANSSHTTSAQHRAQSKAIRRPTIYKRLSTIQKVLALGILATATMLLYVLSKSPSAAATHPSRTPAGQIEPGTELVPSVETSTEDSSQRGQQQAQESEPLLRPKLPLSLTIAETLFLQKNYVEAFSTYSQLHQELATSPQDELTRDFLQLRMALCMDKTANSGEANRLLETALQSRSPIVRAVANYYRSLLEMQKNQYLKAYTRAYQTMALIGAIDFARERTVTLNHECRFLAAESITRKVLSLCDADKDLPPKLWDQSVDVDPFAEMGDAELRPFLNAGLEDLSKGVLGPQIQKLMNSDTRGPACWFVICHRTSIEEVLTRFAANADLDICWTSGHDQLGIRRRPVSLYLPATTTQQFVKVAVGCAGLLAQLDENGAVNLFNPADYSSLSDHVSLLIEEAISLWQRFILTCYDDKRIPNAHFALGLLHTEKGQITDAIAEYKLVANRFSNTSVAPFALLNSSKLKTILLDYLGARNDLLQLIEQDPDTEIAHQACLRLADVAMKAGLKTEAIRLYRKVYNLGFSLESQTSAALGAGRCFYEMNDFQSAVKWLTRYISLAKDRADKDMYSAYFLLGKSNLALGKHHLACGALQYALEGQLSKEQYIETVSALVEAHLKLGNSIDALDTLENVQPWELSEKESVEILLLKCKILRRMGLVEKAIATLRGRAEYISEPQLRTKISFELAKCHVTQGNLELACENLAEMLINVDAGPLAHEIALELAHVCLKLGQDSQAVSVCLQLLNSSPSAQIKEKALNILATAYNRQKNYDKAALALAGQWDTAATQKDKSALDDAPATDKPPQEQSKAGHSTNENKQ